MANPVLQLGRSSAWLTCLCHHTWMPLLLLSPLVSSGQAVLCVLLHSRGDGCKFFHHAVAPVSPLDCVCSIIGLVDPTITAAQHLHLLVQQVLAELVRFRHLRPAQALPARLGGLHLSPQHGRARALCPLQGGAVQRQPGGFYLPQGTLDVVTVPGSRGENICHCVGAFLLTTSRDPKEMFHHLPCSHSHPLKKHDDGCSIRPLPMKSLERPCCQFTSGLTIASRRPFM